LPRRASPPQPEFFVDRSLGRIIVPDAIRAIGFVVHAMADIYPGGEDQSVGDERWIADADAAGWVALTKDERITRYPHEQAALAASRLRVFGIGNQHLTGPEMASYYVANIHRILLRSAKPGPFVDVVLRNGVERRWPRTKPSD